MGKNTACVIGGSGYLASLLIKLLLEKGYTVNATVRDPDNEEKTSHLLALKKLGELKIFKADLTEPGSFDEAVVGCGFVFHVATPVHFASKDPENDMIKPAIAGALNVLNACAKEKSVKRVVLTSSAASVSVNKLKGAGLVMTEENWSDVEFLRSEKPPTWGYPVSKTLAEKEAWKFAKEKGIDLVTVVPALTVGPSLTPCMPSSVAMATSLLTGNEMLVNALKGMQLLSGSISLSHVEDICRAHIFVAERPSAAGRYICCAANFSLVELADFLRNRYPQYNIPSKFGELPLKEKMLSSEKLVKEGFELKYGVEEIYDQTVEYLKSKGLLD